MTSTYMDDSKKNDSKESPVVKSMPAPQTACELFRIVVELQEKVRSLQRPVASPEQWYMPQFLITHPGCCWSGTFHLESIHIRIAEGTNFIKALAIIAADLLAEHLQTIGAEIVLDGQPLDLLPDHPNVPRATARDPKTNCGGNH